MHGIWLIAPINAQQAKSRYVEKNTNEKLLKTFNKMCSLNHLRLRQITKLYDFKSGGDVVTIHSKYTYILEIISL